MKLLVLMRHAKAVQSSSDFDRTLTDKGKEEAIGTGKRLLQKNFKPDVIISSAAKRAKKTAKIVAKELGYDENKIDLRLEIYNADIDDLLHVIRDIDDKHNSAMLFGHNPAFTSMVSYLSDSLIEHLPTAGAAAIEFDITTWKQVSRASGKLLFVEL